jgi:hypothetical protein
MTTEELLERLERDCDGTNESDAETMREAAAEIRSLQAEKEKLRGGLKAMEGAALERLTQLTSNHPYYRIFDTIRATARSLLAAPGRRGMMTDHCERAQEKCLSNEHDYQPTYESFDGERHRCSKCGDSYFLDYEDMK